MSRETRSLEDRLRSSSNFEFIVVFGTHSAESLVERGYLLAHAQWLFSVGYHLLASFIIATKTRND